jgi:hypothetical protein
VLGGVVRYVWNDGVCKRGFPINRCLPVGGGTMNGDIQVVYHVVEFRFRCELKFGVYSVEVI